MRRNFITITVLQILIINLVSAQPSFDWMKDVGAHAYPQKTQVYNVADYGAEGDALKLCTEAIQKAIDDCSKNGGGIVTFSPGIFLTGSVFIKDNVDFKIPKGTMLIGSQHLDDYLKIDTRIAGVEMNWPAALINIIDSKNAAISGDGIINGRGKVFWDKFREMNIEYDAKALRWAVDYDCQRPRGILIANCSDVTVKDIVLYQPGFWSVHILYSHHVTVDNVIISNNIEGRGPSTDGIDIDSSEKVLVQNSNINCNDDNFCLKAGRDADGLRVNRPCQYVVIRNCIAGHGDGLFTCGSETSGGIKHIVAYNLKALGTQFGLRFISTALRGGIMEDIHFYNIEMIGVKSPLILDLNWFPSYSFPVLPEGYHPDSIPAHWKTLLLPVDPEKGLPKFRNIYFENVTASNAEKCVAVYGLQKSTIEDFHFKNVRLQGEKAGNINYAENWHFDGFVIDANDGELEMKNNKNVNPREAERQQENAKKEALKREQQAAEDISRYLSARYPAQVSDVTAGQNKITVHGVYSGKGSYSLCEITPWQDVTRTTVFADKTPLTGSPFKLDFDRFVVRQGVAYDRTLSKWIIVKNGKSKDEIVSHARYADSVYSAQTLAPGVLASKKGLAGSNAQKQQDFDDLQIRSTTVNIWIGRLIYSSAGENRIAHQYGGRTWYFDRTQTETLDKNMQFCAQRNIVVAAIVLVDKASNCPDAGKLLQYPDFTKGNYAMPNMTTPEATLIYAAALDFLADRYCRSDNQYGRIHYWIMHNEVDDSGWTNMGDNRAMMVYMDAYVKSMRLCYNIARQYDSHAEVFCSFTRSWAAAKGTNYAARDMLGALNLYSKAEGDFVWGLGYHPYPESIREPKTWLDASATYSMDTKMITFKNLEVLDKWVKQPENKYKGTTKRTVWLSENGVNSKSYSEADLREQAAGFAWTWKKVQALDGIDAIQWHGWWDQPGEASGGVRIGLRTDVLEKKPVWYLFQAAGTPAEDEAFEPYKAVIGISDWNIVQDF